MRPTPVTSWSSPPDPRPNRIQDKNVSACRINSHALRVLQAKAPHIVADQRFRIKLPLGAFHNLNQPVVRGLEDEQAMEPIIEGHVDRVLNLSRDAG